MCIFNFFCSSFDIAYYFSFYFTVVANLRASIFYFIFNVRLYLIFVFRRCVLIFLLCAYAFDWSNCASSSHLTVFLFWLEIRLKIPWFSWIFFHVEQILFLQFVIQIRKYIFCIVMDVINKWFNINAILINK